MGSLLLGRGRIGEGDGRSDFHTRVGRRMNVGRRGLNLAKHASAKGRPKRLSRSTLASIPPRPTNLLASGGRGEWTERASQQRLSVGFGERELDFTLRTRDRPKAAIPTVVLHSSVSLSEEPSKP